MGDTALEIERKFLIRIPDMGMLAECPGHRIRHITQNYLHMTDAITERRVRRCVEDETVTLYVTEKREISGRGECSRQETEREISEDEYRRLLDYRDMSVMTLTKTRHVIPYEGHVIEIDTYPFDKRFAILEVELEDEDEPVTLPPWAEVVREVTDNRAFRNRSLAQSQPKGLSEL